MKKEDKKLIRNILITALAGALGFSLFGVPGLCACLLYLIIKKF